MLKALRAGLGCPPEEKSFNNARQRGPLGSEVPPGPRQMSPNAEIYHDGMHARPLGPLNPLAHEFSWWSRCILRVQTDNTLWQTRLGPKRTYKS